MYVGVVNKLYYVVGDIVKVYVLLFFMMLDDVDVNLDI